jgi:hypothetical protein
VSAPRVRAIIMKSRLGHVSFGHAGEKVVAARNNENPHFLLTQRMADDLSFNLDEAAVFAKRRVMSF